MQPDIREPVRTRAASLDARLAALRERFPAAESAAIAEFARGLFQRAGGSALAELSDGDLAALVLAAFRFFAHMTAPVRCRVWNPTRDRGGWESTCTIVESHLADRPFIVDTVRMFLDEERLGARLLVHPIYAVERELDGTLQRIAPPDAPHPKESFVHASVERVPDEDLARLEQTLGERLGDLALATDDFPRMLERTESVRRELQSRRSVAAARRGEIDEVREFLLWLANGAFVFLGCRSYLLGVIDGRRTLEVEHGSGLGILRKEERSTYASPRALDDLPFGAAERITGGDLLIVAHTDAPSPIHRSGRMIYVGVKRLAADGSIAGEHRFLGLFTSKAQAEEAAEVPVLRQKLAYILEAEQVVRNSHDHKQIVAIFNSIPKTELFTVSAEELRADIRTILSIQRPDEIRVTLRADVLGRGVSVMVVLPRDRFSGDVRSEVRDLLEQWVGGTVVDDQVALGDEPLARLHFYLRTPDTVPVLRAADLEREIAERVRSWDDRLAARLKAKYGALRGRDLADRYAELFTEEYKAATDVETAVGDVARLEELVRTGAMQIALEDARGADAGRLTHLKLFLRGEDIVLSDFLPVLENFDLRVFAEDSVELGSGPERIFLHRFEVQDSAGRALDVARVAPLLGPAILEIRGGRAESDPLNRLVTRAGLTEREVACLRTYRNLAFQAGGAPSRKALGDVLVNHPGAARSLFGVFEARFRPDEADHQAAAEQRRSELLDALREVETAGEDRMLRTFLALVEATVRTNYYRPPRADHPYLSIKIHSQALEFMPKPRPLYEVYVHSARMEGVHLRGAKVARGGIRFSDRHDDFRTEILGLMKTQMVKNAVIVPAGSKGGFIVKRFAVAEDRAAEIRECYSTLIRGLLDLTDDIEDGEIVPPSGVVRHDDDDPYLVVAADKGTASFSDLANSIAQEYGFWLDDAFASGGSHGYDHKKEGITARGAWECVRTHFRELGKNPDRDRFTAVGIGDMSGDVFGNGMLLSRTIQLRAAFNHEHVFLDPDPDPETSYRERERLFRLPRSRWTDYDRAAMSAGAMVVPRTAKAAPLTPEVRAMLGIDAPALDGEGLVRTLLRMETELLFNGGIGTYVKASAETQAEAGDSTNDPVRVNGSDVRAAVAAEGGNLGFTQRGRIEYALRGGRLNTDAIDNSGGVDLSDHEVNLKILLRPLVERGVIKFEARNALLDRVKPDVIRHVLDHNARQSWLLTVDQNRSRVRLVEFRDHMTDLEQEGLLDRLLEALPDREALRARRSAFLGFTRPELAVLAAYSKISLQRRLLASRWIDDPYLEGFLTSYFPQGIVDRFPDAVRAHRLRREIAAIELTNRVIDRMGAAYPQRMLRDTGTDPASAVVACAVVFGITDADRLWDRIVESPLRVDDAVGLCLRWEEAVEAAAKFLVGAPGGMPPMSESVERWRRPVADVADVLEDTLPVTLRNEAAEEERRLETMGLTAGVARSLTALSTLRASLEVAAIAAAAGVPLRDTTQAYQQVGTLADFATIERWIAGVSGDDRWEKRAAEALREDLSAARHEITLAALARGEATLDERLAGFAAAVESDLAKVRSLGEDLRSGRKASLAGMIVIVRELRRLAERLRT